MPLVRRFGWFGCRQHGTSDLGGSTLLCRLERERDAATQRRDFDTPKKTLLCLQNRLRRADAGEFAMQVRAIRCHELSFEDVSLVDHDGAERRELLLC